MPSAIVEGVSNRPEPKEADMHPLFVELFIDTQDDVLAEDEERRARRARRRRARQVMTVRSRPAPRPR
jgi:hypothetical protein